MSKIVINPEREIVSAGLHNAVCSHVFDVGLQPGYQGKEPRHQSVHFYQVEEPSPNDTTENTTWHMPMRVSDLLYSKSKLHGIVKALRGGLTAEEEQLNEFDPQVLVGCPCTIQVEHGKRDDGTKFAKIATVLPHDKRNPVLKPTFNPKTDLPDWVLRLREDQLSEE
jgi:hypothetical protein